MFEELDQEQRYFDFFIFCYKCNLERVLDP